MFWIYILCDPSEVFGAPALVLSTNSKQVPLVGHLDVLEDPGTSWLLEDVRSPQNERYFESVDQVPNFGYTNSAYWIRFRVKNTNPSVHEWLLELESPLAEQIELYEPMDGDRWLVKKSGKAFPYSTRDVEHPNFVFRIVLRPGQEKNFYMRLKHSQSLQLPLVFWEPVAFGEKRSREIWSVGGFFGSVLAMAAFHLFIYFSLRDKSYIYYVLYLFGFAAVMANLKGLDVQYLWPESPRWALRSGPFMYGFALFWSIQFAQTFLDTRKHVPSLHTPLTLAKYFFAAITTTSFLPVPIFFVHLVILAATFVSSLMVASASLICFFRGYRAARFYILAWGSLFGAALLFLLREEHENSQHENLRKKESLNRDLKRLVEKRTTELHRAKQDVKLSNEAKVRFLANMSHEIRTPLNAISGFAQILLKQKGGPGIQREYLEHIRTATSNLTEMFENVLIWSRLEASNGCPAQETVRIRKLVRNACLSHMHIVRLKRLRLRYCYADELPESFVSDRTRLMQILSNLIGNAVKFTQEGGRVEIHVCLRDEAFMVFQVKDEGVGIAKDKQDVVFDAFQQADNSISRDFGGSGLGLAISRELVRRLGGDISLDSLPNEGSLFEFWIPYVAPKQAEKEETIDERWEKKSYSNGYRILLVEDNPINQRMMSVLLKGASLPVELASDGEECLEKIGDFRPDLILMDLHMPRLDGISTVRRIRKDPEFANVPVVALTADTMQERYDEAMEAGFDDYLTKPVNFEKLFAVLERYLA